MTVPASSPLSPARTALLLAAGVCALASTAPAQTPSSPTAVSPLTVQGASPAALTKLAQSFVQAYALRSAKVDQLPRWHEAICVTVRGLVPDKAAAVAARVEDLAKVVGLKIMKPGCRPNIEIMFTDKPQALANTIGEAYLGFHAHNEIAKVRTITHPIQAWYATATAGAAGATGLAFAGSSGGTNGTKQIDPGTDPAAWEANFGQIGAVTLSMEVVDNPEDVAPVGCGDSRFSSCMKSMFRNVIVIADANAVVGKDMGAVTDYVAMLAVSQPRSLDGCYALPSVIDLLAKSACPDRDPPAGLTPADSAYLTGLYGSDAEARTTSAESDIARHMAAILIRAKTAGR